MIETPTIQPVRMSSADPQANSSTVAAQAPTTRRNGSRTLTANSSAKITSDCTTSHIHGSPSAIGSTTARLNADTSLTSSPRVGRVRISPNGSPASAPTNGISP